MLFSLQLKHSDVLMRFVSTSLLNFWDFNFWLGSLVVIARLKVWLNLLVFQFHQGLIQSKVLFDFWSLAALLVDLVCFHCLKEYYQDW